MRRPFRYAPLSLALALAAAGGLASQAQAAETFKLDLADGRNADANPANAPAVSSALAAGQHYIVTVTGTGSIWEPSAFTDNGTCGVAEASPIELSPGRPNAVAAWDAATVFAAPKGAKLSPFGMSCTAPNNTPPLSSTGVSHPVAGFEFSLDGGKYLRPDPIGGARTTPVATHTYSWDVVGTGQPARFRFSDAPSTDNSGVLTITVRGAGESDVATVIAAAQKSNDQIVPVNVVVPVAATESVKAVGKRTCTGTPRKLTLQLTEPKGTDFAKATIFLNGKKNRVLFRATKRKDRRLIYLSGKKLGQVRPQTITNLPSKNGQLKLKVTIVTTRGQTLTVTRTVKACSKSKPRTVTFK